MRNVFPHEVSFANITLLYQYAMFRPLQLITIGKSTISIYYLSDQKRFHMTVGTTLLLEFTKKNVSSLRNDLIFLWKRFVLSGNANKVAITKLLRLLPLCQPRRVNVESTCQVVFVYNICSLVSARATKMSTLNIEMVGHD